LFEQLERRAASRAAWTAGNSSATSTPMMAITTSSSTSVKARRLKAFDTFISVIPCKIMAEIDFHLRF
jgi:hypothetical protein